jgi:transketolase N-terminal domain/subunit
MFAGHERLGNIVNVIDMNQQADSVLVLGSNRSSTSGAFGWWAEGVDGTTSAAP